MGWGWWQSLDTFLTSYGPIIVGVLLWYGLKMFTGHTGNVTVAIDQSHNYGDGWSDEMFPPGAATSEDAWWHDPDDEDEDEPEHPR